MPWRTPPPDCDDPTLEFFFPKEWWMEGNTVSMITKADLNRLAREFVLEEFAAIWEVDSGVLSEWMAEKSHIYAALTDEEEIDQVLDAFTQEVDSLVRVAIADFKAADSAVQQRP